MMLLLLKPSLLYFIRESFFTWGRFIDTCIYNKKLLVDLCDLIEESCYIIQCSCIMVESTLHVYSHESYILHFIIMRPCIIFTYHIVMRISLWRLSHMFVDHDEDCDYWCTYCMVTAADYFLGLLVYVATGIYIYVVSYDSLLRIRGMLMLNI